MRPPLPADDRLNWPPSPEELDAIEVVELSPTPVAGAGADIASKQWPEPARATATVPAGTPPVAAEARIDSPPHTTGGTQASLEEVIELDVRGGPESYVIDLRTAPTAAAPAPASPARVANEHAEIQTGAAALSEAAGRVDGPSERAAAGTAAMPDTPPPLVGQPPDVEWPPREADLEAIQVVELQPSSSSPPLLASWRRSRVGPDAKAAASVGGDLVPATDPLGSGLEDRFASNLSWDSEVDAGAEAVDLPDHAQVDQPLVARGRSPLAVFAGIAACLAVAIGVAIFMRGSPEPPTQEPEATASLDDGVPASGHAATEAEPVVPAPAQRDELAPLRAAYQAGDRAGAVRQAAALLRATAPPGGTAELVGGWLDTAQSQADAARRAALQASPGAQASAVFGQASQRQRDAVTAWQTGRLESAYLGFSDAERAFRRLASSPAPGPAATVAGTTPSSSPGPDAVRTPPAEASPAPALTAPVPAADSPPEPATPAIAPVATPSPGATAAARPPEPARPEPTAREPSPAETGLPARPVADDSGVRRALRAYQGAYERLDAQAAAAVYPGLDARALARAFDGLRSQKLEFDRCDVNLSGATARAACVGRSAFVPKVGSQSPRVEARRWTFEFERRGDDWRIVQATIGRP